MKYINSMRCVLVFFILCAASLSVISTDSSAMEFGDPAGSVRVAEGDSWIMRDKEKVAVAPGLYFHTGDILHTGPNGKMGITFRDNTRFSMGPDSELIVEDFVFQPREKRYSMVVSMVKGTFSFLSGLIGKLSPESAEVKTPVGTIGIRGTHFFAKIEGE